MPNKIIGRPASRCDHGDHEPSSKVCIICDNTLKKGDLPNVTNLGKERVRAQKVRK